MVDLSSYLKSLGSLTLAEISTFSIVAKIDEKKTIDFCCDDLSNLFEEKDIRRSEALVICAQFIFIIAEKMFEETNLSLADQIRMINSGIIKEKLDDLN